MVKYAKAASSPKDKIIVHWGDETETHSNLAEALAYWSNMKRSFTAEDNVGLARLANDVYRELVSGVTEVFIYQVDIDEYEN